MKSANRQLLSAIAIAACGLMTVPAQAAGAFDGLYKSPITQNGYISVSQKGNHIIAAIFDYFPIPRGALVLPTNPPLQSTQLNTWDLLSGEADGLYVRLTGLTTLNACQSTFDVWLSTEGDLILRPIEVTTAPEGVAQGLSCRQAIFGDKTAPRVQ